jgi:hypothetical protein
MKLTDELFERGKSQKEICTIIDDNYVLLHKTMPCSDQELEQYLKNMLEAKRNGINMACVTDYKLIEGSTRTFGNISYTSGVFIEERAKGVTSSDNTATYLSPNEEYNYDEVANDYLKRLTEYVELLEYRDNSTQEVYDKFVNDVYDLRKYNITIDPKPLNFFYSKEDGYTLIDPIPWNNQGESDLNYFPSYILTAIFGYGCPYISAVDSKRLITQDLYVRFQRAQSSLVNKVVIALKKRNVPDEDIQNAINRMSGLSNNNFELVDINDLSQKISELNGKQKSL